MTNEQMQAAAQIVMQTALETMAAANGATIEQCRQAVLSGVENAVGQFNQLVQVGYESAVKAMYGA